MHKTLHATAFCLALLSNTIAQAQGWVGTYSPDRMMGINGLLERPDGSFLVTGFNTGAAGDGTRVMLIDPAGAAVGAMDNDSIHSITYAANTLDGGFAILGAAVGNGTAWAGHSLLRVDADGLELWHQHVDSMPVGNAGNIAVDAAPDGGFFCVFNLKDTVNDLRFVRVKRLDATGGILWQRNFSEDDTTAYAFGIKCTADGGALVNMGTVGFLRYKLFQDRCRWECIVDVFGPRFLGIHGLQVGQRWQHPGVWRIGCRRNFTEEIGPGGQ